MYQGKVDLHLHLDGSLSEQVVFDLAKRGGFPMSMEEICDSIYVPADCNNLVEYLQRFELPTRVLQTEYALEVSAYELVRRLAAQGLIYAEIRFAPQLHTRAGLTQKEVLQSVLKGVRQAQQDHPSIRVGVLLCAMIGSPREVNEQIVPLAAEFMGQGVVGVDLAGAEDTVPLETYAPIFEEAYRQQIPFTLHAGERGNAENVRKAVELGARRVGHGCGAVRSESCMDLLRREKILVEACVVSNLHTKIVLDPKTHPMAEFFRRGIPVSINTDNITCSNTTLQREHQVIYDAFGFTDEEFRQMDAYAIGGAFLPEAEKQALLARL